MRAILDAIAADPETTRTAYILLTLTVRNCEANDLSSTLDAMLAGWERMTKTKPWKRVALGAFRALEITHNVDPKSDSYDTFHPHIHAVIAVKPSYFTSRDYLSQLSSAL